MRTTLARFALIAFAATSAVSCVTRNPDIDRVDPDKIGYYDKAMFSGTWYMRRTVVDAPYETAWVGVGSGDLFTIEKVRWEVRENALIGWRAYEYIAGSEGADDPGRDYKGGALVAYAISDHFDIKKDYNTGTGEEMNTIGRNYDRPWYERKFIQVNWATNLAPTLDLLIGTSYVASVGYWIDPHDITNPDRARISDNQIDLVNSLYIVPDYWTCWGMFERFYQACPAGNVKVRQSFEKITTPSDYQPLYYPDRLTARDEAGNVITDTAGKPVEIPMMDRFGFYRLDRVTYDHERDLTETGRLYRVMRFNIWEQNIGADGQPVPYAQRKVKPIVYYTNAGFPTNLRKAADEVGAHWNKVFKEMVNELKYAGGRPLAQVEDVFIVKENDCNINNVNRYISEHSLAGQVAEAFATTTSALAVTPENLERVCTAVETLSEGKFTWQRMGDIKYNMIVYLLKPLQLGWGGYGPMLSDPESGEIVESTAWLNGANYEMAASWYADTVLAWQKALSLPQVMNGDLVKRQVAANLKNLQSGPRQASQQFMDELERRFQGMEGDGGPLKRADSAGGSSGLQKIAGTRFERELLLDQDTLLLRNQGRWTPAMPTTEDVYERAQINKWLNPDIQRAQRDRDRVFGQHTLCNASFNDNALAGLAVELLDETTGDLETRWNKIRQALLHRIFVAVALHEVGHNLGLRHNFEGSYDSLNYPENFWYAEELPTKLDDAIGALQNVPTANRVVYGNKTMVEVLGLCKAFYEAHKDEGAIEPTSQQCLKNDEAMYSSIMEYMPKFNSDFAGLGRYDSAAIKFVYGNLVEVFDDTVALPTVPAGKTLKGVLEEADYHKFNEPGQYFAQPGCDLDLSCSSGLQNRKYKTFDPRAIDAREVPYRFCSDEFADYRLNCLRSDLGGSPTEVVRNKISDYKNYFFFWNFIRDRYLWDVNGAINRSVDTFYTIKSVFQNFYFQRGKRGSEFMATDLAKDMGLATAEGLNFIQEVLGTPNPGKHCYLSGAYYPERTVVNYAKGTYRDDLVAWMAPALGSVSAAENRINSIQHCVDEPAGTGIPTTPIAGYECNNPTACYQGLNTCDCVNVNNQPVKSNIARDVFGVMNAKGQWRVVDIPLGTGRPYGLSFTDDYVDYKISMIGTYWDKLYALLSLSDTYAYFDKLTDEDLRAYSIGYFKLFKPEMIKLFASIIAQRTFDFAPVIKEDAVTGKPIGYAPRLFVDGNTLSNGLTPATTGAPIMPTFGENLAYYAMVFGQSYLTSTRDSSLDFNKYMRIGLKGSYDDFAGFDTAPADQKVEFTHPISHYTYRAMKTPSQQMIDHLYAPNAIFPGGTDGVGEGDFLHVCSDTAPVSRGDVTCAHYEIFRRVDDHRVQVKTVIPGGEQNSLATVSVTTGVDMGSAQKTAPSTGLVMSYANGVSIAFDMLSQLNLINGYWMQNKLCLENKSLPPLADTSCDIDHPSQVNPATPTDPYAPRVCLTLNKDSRCAECLKWNWNSNNRSWNCIDFAAQSSQDRLDNFNYYDELLNKNLELVENARALGYFYEFGYHQ